MVPGRNSGSSRQDPSVEPGRSGTSRLPQVAGGGCVVGPHGGRVARRGGVANASAGTEAFGHSFGPHRVLQSTVGDAHSGHQTLLHRIPVIERCRRGSVIAHGVGRSWPQVSSQGDCSSVLGKLDGHNAGHSKTPP